MKRWPGIDAALRLARARGGFAEGGAPTDNLDTFLGELNSPTSGFSPTAWGDAAQNLALSQLGNYSPMNIDVASIANAPPGYLANGPLPPIPDDAGGGGGGGGGGYTGSNSGFTGSELGPVLGGGFTGSGPIPQGGLSNITPIDFSSSGSGYAEGGDVEPIDPETRRRAERFAHGMSSSPPEIPPLPPLPRLVREGRTPPPEPKPARRPGYAEGGSPVPEWLLQQQRDVQNSDTGMVNPEDPNPPPGPGAAGALWDTATGLAPIPAVKLPWKTLAALGGAGLLGVALGQDTQAASSSKAPPPDILPGLPPVLKDEYRRLQKRVRDNDFESGTDRKTAIERMHQIEGLSNDYITKGTSNTAEQERQAVERANAAFDKEMGRDFRFAESPIGKEWQKLGPLGPGAVGALTGFVSRARHPGTSWMNNVLRPLLWGTAAGGFSANWPQMTDAMFAPLENPEKRAYDRASFHLPEGNPDKERFRQRALELPENNPVYYKAMEELNPTTHWPQLLRRTAVGAGEGALGAELGSGAVEIGGRGYNWLANIMRGIGRGIANRGSAGPGPGPGGGPGGGTSGAGPGGGGNQGPTNTGSTGAGPGTGPGGGQGGGGLGPTDVDPWNPADLTRPAPPKTKRAPRTMTEAEKAKREAAKLFPKKKPPPVDEDLGYMMDGGRVYRADGGAVHAGPIQNAADGGRTDTVPLDVASGSYVVPADIISGLGQGDTVAGYKILSHMFGPQAPRVGPDGKTVPIMAAGGEYVLTPDAVARVGRGDVKAGHDALDAWVRTERRKHIMALKKLPGPARD